MAAYFVGKKRTQKDKILSILWHFEVGNILKSFESTVALNTYFLDGNKQKMDSILEQTYYD